MIARLRLQCLTCLRLRPVRGDRSSRLLPRAGEPAYGTAECSGLEHGRAPSTPGCLSFRSALTSGLDTRAGADQGFVCSFSSLCEFAL